MITYKIKKELTLYVNSVKQSSENISNIGDISGDESMIIGGPSKESLLNYFNGSMDNVTMGNLISKNQE